jgi:hypothetical protein
MGNPAVGKRVAVITRDPDRHYQALRSSLGLLLERHAVSLFVLDHEIASSEEYVDNLGFVDEMGGARYSNDPANVDRHGFRPVALGEVGRLLAEHELIIPF